MNIHRTAGGLAVLLLGLACYSCARQTHAPVTDPNRVVLPYGWVGNIDKSGFNEPSGAVFDPVRGTLFVVGDEGDVCEMTTTGRMLREERLIEGADFEGITRVPETGLLYLAIEGEDAVLEVEPDTFAMHRRFELPRETGGIELFPAGGEGIEGITLVPDAQHRQGGTFFLANQSFSLEPDGEPSVIVQAELPLRERDRTGPVRVLNWFEPGVIDISALHYDEQTRSILARSYSARKRSPNPLDCSS